MIKLKVKHTYGVISLSEYIAKDLNLSKEDIELSKLIALLHDIARFEQVKGFGDYRDYKNIDTKTKIENIRKHALNYINDKLNT